MHLFCSRPKDAGGEEEAKAGDRQEEANGNESGLDELMLLAGSRRLSEEPETAVQGEASGTPQPEVPTGNEPQPRDEDEVTSNLPPAVVPVISGFSSQVVLVEESGRACSSVCSSDLMTVSAQDMAQEEADAVAALMAAASGDIRSEPATDTVDQLPPGTHRPLHHRHSSISAEYHHTCMHGSHPDCKALSFLVNIATAKKKRKSCMHQCVRH